MKIVVVPVGEAGRIEDINSMDVQGVEIIGERNFDRADLGHGLYLIVGDTSAAREPFNFKITNGNREDDAHGNVIFVRRETTTEGLEYKSLSDGEAEIIARLFEIGDTDRRILLDTRDLHHRL